MKANELRDLSLPELEQKEQELSQELFNLRIRHSLGQVDNPLQLRLVRRDLARVKTCITEQRADAADADQ